MKVTREEDISFLSSLQIYVLPLQPTWTSLLAPKIPYLKPFVRTSAASFLGHGVCWPWLNKLEFPFCLAQWSHRTIMHSFIGSRAAKSSCVSHVSLLPIGHVSMYLLLLHWVQSLQDHWDLTEVIQYYVELWNSTTYVSMCLITPLPSLICDCQPISNIMAIYWYCRSLF
jgi:hypothetical protein